MTSAPWKLFWVTVVVMVMLTSCAAQATPTVKTSATLVQVAPVQRTTIAATYRFTGSVVPLSSVDIQPRQGGRIVKMLVSVGQTVHTGQVLLELDHTQQSLAVEQAKAALEQAQAKLDALKAGPRPEQVAQAEIAVEVAKSKLQAMLNGPRPQNVASAQAVVQSAKAAADAAEQKLLSLEHPRSETIAQAKLALDEAKQRLAIIQEGPRPEVVAQAQAQLTSAEAQLTALQHGSTAADLAPLQQAVEVAKNQLNAAQISRDATCAQVGRPTGFGSVGTQAACNAANAQVNAAQSAVNEAQATLEKAEQPPTASALQQAKAAVTSAQAALQQAEHPYTAQDLMQAQDAVSSAEQQLAIAEHPASPQDLQSAKDAVLQAEATVAEAAQSLALAENPYTLEDIQQAKLAVQNAEQQLALTEHPYTPQDIEQAQAAVDQAKAAYDQAVQNLKDMTITSPINGVITQKNFSQGALVSPSDTLLTVESPQNVIEINVPATEIAGIAVGTSAIITASQSSPLITTSGRVTSVAPSASTKSRSFLVKVTPSAESVHLLPGTFATVSLIPFKHTNVLAIPNSAIVQRQGQTVVFVVKNGLAKQVAIQVGVSNGTVTEIVSGLKIGQNVITQGQDTLVDGDRVTVATTAAG